MGLFFTLVYIFVSYMGPELIFGDLAQYRVQLIIVVLAMLGSIPKLAGAKLMQARPTTGLLGLTFVVMVSYAVNGLGRQMLDTITDFLPQAIAYFLILLNCRKRWHLQAVVVVITTACLYTIVRGWQDLQAGVLVSKYLYDQSYGGPESVMRLRGMGAINDPNDFGQLLALTLPLLFLFWRKGKGLLNFLRVILPGCVLFYGLFLTHSRSAMMALLAILLVVGRRRLGLIPALILSGLGAVGATAAGWAGGAGRGVSADQGADRLEAWSTGLQLIRSHPVFGVGYKQFTEYYEITAHNTIVVTGAELGLVGLICWVMFTLPAVRDMVVSGPPAREQRRRNGGTGEEAGAEESAGEEPARRPGLLAEPEAEPVATWRSAAPATTMRLAGEFGRGEPARMMMGGGLRGPAREQPESGAGELEDVPFGMPSQVGKALPAAEIHRMAAVTTAALTGFLVSGWFLSRAYVMALFLAGGMAEVIYRMGLEAGAVPPQMPWGRVLKFSAMTSVGLILVVYVILRLQRLMPHAS